MLVFKDAMMRWTTVYKQGLLVQSLSVGAKLWGCIAEIHPKELIVSLPHGLRGRVQGPEVRLPYHLKQPSEGWHPQCMAFCNHCAKPGRHTLAPHGSRIILSCIAVLYQAFSCEARAQETHTKKPPEMDVLHALSADERCAHISVSHAWTGVRCAG